jgi:hypothetical protein
MVIGETLSQNLLVLQNKTREEEERGGRRERSGVREGEAGEVDGATFLSRVRFFFFHLTIRSFFFSFHAEGNLPLVSIY